MKKLMYSLFACGIFFFSACSSGTGSADATTEEAVVEEAVVEEAAVDSTAEEATQEVE